MSRPKPEMLTLSRDDLRQCLERVQGQVSASDFETLSALSRGYLYLIAALSAVRVSVARLKRYFLGARTEKTKDVLGTRPGPSPGNGPGSATGAPQPPPSDSEKASGQPPSGTGGPKPRKRPDKGHGRNGADAYTGADRVSVRHQELSPGCRCPECRKGKLEPLPSGKLLRLTGSPPVRAKIWELEHLRCGLCKTIFHVEVPAEARGDKHDPTAVAMVALLHFANGVPFHRLAQLQSLLGIPLPASVQYKILHEAATALRPVYNEMIRQAAQCSVVYTDDTGMKILSLLAEIKAASAGQPTRSDLKRTKKGAPRTGVFTTGIVAIIEGRQIALYFTGQSHAGENLDRLLQQRAQGLPPPIHMSDGLDRNEPKTVRTVIDKCLAHGRRLFVDIVTSFPDACRRVLEDLQFIYYVDKIAKEKNLTGRERLYLHQEKSAPVMNRLRRWMTDQLLDAEVEPNSGVGQAIAYILRLWEPLTLFLRVENAPLDNNLVERILKKAIRHRRNSLFYKSANGAAVGDLFMALLETCWLNQVDSFQYLTALLKNRSRLQDSPECWMPWNYKAMLTEGKATPQDQTSPSDGKVPPGPVDVAVSTAATATPATVHPSGQSPVSPPRPPPPPLPAIRWPADRSLAVLNAMSPQERAMRHPSRPLRPPPAVLCQPCLPAGPPEDPHT